MIRSLSDGRSTTRSQRARARALETASALFYAQGVRAVGMEQIVERSGIAKTTIYRHFPSKDALVEAFLKKENDEFWHQWDEVVGDSSGIEALERLAEWIGCRISRDGYRGCPQINVAAEFALESHPARTVARVHKQDMHRRLSDLCRELGLADTTETAMQIALLFDGAFTSDGRIQPYDAPTLLKKAVGRLVRAKT